MCIRGIDRIEVSKPLRNVLIQTPSNGKATDQSQNTSSKQSIYQEIASGLKFECAEFLIEDAVKKEVDSLRGTFPDAEDLVLCYKDIFLNEDNRGREWSEFLTYLSNCLENDYEQIKKATF